MTCTMARGNCHSPWSSIRINKYYCDYNVETNIEDAIHIGDFGTAEQDIEITNAKRSTSGRPTGSVFYTKR